jgi:hypothetical protein
MFIRLVLFLRRWKKIKRMLFLGLSPMNYTMFRPLHLAIEKYTASRIFFAFKAEDADYSQYLQLGVEQSRIVRLDKAVKGIWDSVFLADFARAYFRWNSRFVQIYHGVAGKSFTYMDEKGISRTGDFRYHYELSEYDIVFFPNNTDYSTAVTRRLVKPGAGHVVGMCCLDEMRANCTEERLQVLKAKYIPCRFAEKEVIVYAPTFGDGASYNRKGDDILRALSERDAFIIVKPHPRCLRSQVGDSGYDLATFMARTFALGNYSIVTTTPYEIMPIADVMISDFSSITFEYSLLRRPIYLFVGNNPTVADSKQLELLKQCCFVFHESDAVLPNFFSASNLDQDKIAAMEMLEQLYLANYGSATRTAMKILLDEKIIRVQKNSSWLNTLIV